MPKLKIVKRYSNYVGNHFVRFESSLGHIAEVKVRNRDLSINLTTDDARAIALQTLYPNGPLHGSADA